ncbi:Protein of unknown function [Fulvimarina manganoxydans]|uniref:DUF3768 domain-containing protein n=2 Tax=Fulvimarina manganoxydans TaxID=937218 RepID=A0A1W2C0H9_9HYPH|nr:Protein of unknown function [Fulvimarina manganoxydans]
MAQFQCTACGAIETLDHMIPDCCSSCGSSLVKLRRAEAIAAKNDAFRRNLFFLDQKEAPDGRMVVTQGIGNLGGALIALILRAVALQTTFPKDDDPYGEHDFGTVTIDDTTVFWKIDSYDAAYEFGSENPLDDAMTRRVLTAMLAEEY